MTGHVFRSQPPRTVCLRHVGAFVQTPASVWKGLRRPLSCLWRENARVWRGAGRSPAQSAQRAKRSLEPGPALQAAVLGPAPPAAAAALGCSRRPAVGPAQAESRRLSDETAVRTRETKPTGRPTNDQFPFLSLWSIAVWGQPDPSVIKVPHSPLIPPPNPTQSKSDTSLFRMQGAHWLLSCLKCLEFDQEGRLSGGGGGGGTWVFFRGGDVRISVELNRCSAGFSFQKLILPQFKKKTCHCFFCTQGMPYFFSVVLMDQTGV